MDTFLSVAKGRWAVRGSENLYVMYQYPIGSMYAIYDNIYHQYTPNVTIYTVTYSYNENIYPLVI